MMTHAYDEDYLDDVMQGLGGMFQYAVCDCGRDIDGFFCQFISSGVAEQIEKGNPRYLCGLSGIELAGAVFYGNEGSAPDIEATFQMERTPEYWVGWILAYYQWETGLKFRDMLECGLPPSKVLSMYLLHEADKSKFVEVANDIVRRGFAKRETNLRRIRRSEELSQMQLAAKSGVSVRMIQLYEQKRNSINKAQAITLLALSRSLFCKIEDLLDPIIP